MLVHCIGCTYGKKHWFYVVVWQWRCTAESRHIDRPPLPYSVTSWYVIISNLLNLISIKGFSSKCAKLFTHLFPAIPYVCMFAGVVFHDQLPSREMMHIYLYRLVKIQDLHASNVLYSVYSFIQCIQFIHVRTYIMCCIHQVGLCVYCTRYRVWIMCGHRSGSEVKGHIC